MKIYIIGAAGSGKTTLANKISDMKNIQSVNLDNIFWTNESTSYGIKRNIIERNSIYKNILNNEAWIIEGAYVEWPKEGLYKADQIIYLNINTKEINRRIINRYIKRKLNIEKSNKGETLLGVIRLLRWNMKQITEINELINEMKIKEKKIIELKNVYEIEQYLMKI